jgi:hypothetical protein
MATRECDLYLPVKQFLESRGFEVRAEVGKCDAVAVCGDMVLAVELKLSFGLPVLYQALERLSAVDVVYVAVDVPAGRKARTNWDAKLCDAVRLCRMLGVGLIAVRDGRVEVHAEPDVYQPRKAPRRRVKLMREFKGRSGDHNVGGTTRRPRITRYREEALRCAHALRFGEVLKASLVRDMASVPQATAMLRNNVYGWFDKVQRGTYAITPAGAEALTTYADVVSAQQACLAQEEALELAA